MEQLVKLHQGAFASFVVAFASFVVAFDSFIVAFDGFVVALAVVKIDSFMADCIVEPAIVDFDSSREFPRHFFVRHVACCEGP
jgi:hypothetical protein